jgi:hypothetical protein
MGDTRIREVVFRRKERVERGRRWMRSLGANPP